MKKNSLIYKVGSCLAGLFGSHLGSKGFLSGLFLIGNPIYFEFLYLKNKNK
jgi:hypothetical protein